MTCDVRGCDREAIAVVLSERFERLVEHRCERCLQDDLDRDQLDPLGSGEL